MSLLNELKRRNVLRVAVLYIVAAWIILQVASVLFTFLKVPDWAGTLILVILLLGLPLVLIFAWAFEITPEGIKREHEVDRSQSITHETGRKLNVATVVLAAIAILLIVAQPFVPALKRSRSSGGSSSDVKAASIAVLPFVNMSSDKEQEYFSDGLSEELLNLLAKIPHLTVISRTSSFQFKGKNEDVRAIAQKLGVAHVLEGSVRKAGERVRITAQLIKAADGAHVWSETYDRTIDDIFAIQDEIAGEVVKALEVTLMGNAPAVHVEQQNTEAYNYLLQARHFAGQRTAETSGKALIYLDSALSVDPKYAAAWAEKSRVIRLQVARGAITINEGVPQSRAAAQRALALDPKLTEAHVAVASLEYLFEWDWDEAEKHLREAEVLDPNHYQTLTTKANLAATLGKFPEAVATYRRIVQRNPLTSGSFANLGLALVRIDSMSSAIVNLRKSLELAPGADGIHAFIATTMVLQDSATKALPEVEREPSGIWKGYSLAIVYHALGRKADSDKALRDFVQQYSSEAAFQVAEIHAYRGEIDQAFKWLDRAYELRDAGITEIIGDPLMKNIVDDPRYGALLRRLKLPES